MNRLWMMATAAATACISMPAAAQEVAKQVIAVPGFANFAEIDPRDNTVWINNQERIEHWSTAGKLGQIVMEKPCGAMFIVGADLWAADCKDGTLNRIDTASLKITAGVTTGMEWEKRHLARHAVLVS
jgi:virginiamycin B lyase